MATEICPNEGKDWIGGNAIAGASLYAFLIRTKTVGAATIIAETVQSDLTEATGTGYARQSVTMGSITDGILQIPTFSWSTGAATNWPSDITAWGLTDAPSGAGTVVYVWDTSTTRNMASAGRTLTVPTCFWFFFNPGEA